MNETKKASTENKAVEVKSEIVELSKAIKKDMKLDHKSGIATVSADLYEKSLPETITPEIVKTLQEHNTRFATAGFMALGETSIPAMKKNGELTHTTLSIPMIGKDTIEYKFNRSQQVSNPSDPENKITKFGTGTMSFDIYGAGSRGELKKVKTLLAEQAAAALKD